MAKNSPDGSPLALAALVVAAVLVVLYFGYAFASAWPFVGLDAQANAHFTILFYFLEKVFYLIGASAILFVSLSAGLFILGRLGVSGLPVMEETVLGAALGLGALALATLILGLAGVLNSGVAMMTLIALGALGARRVPAWFHAVTGAKSAGWSWTERLLLAAAAAGGLLAVVYAFNPPTDYDVLEYHLGAPAYWFSTGSIRFIRYNVYSNFPSNAEMLYLFSMALTGSKFAGAMLGKVLNAFVAIAAAGSAWSLGRWLHSRAAGIFAAAALITAGGFFQVATAGYVEPLQVLYTVLAVLATGRFLQRGGTGMLLAAGCATGLAMGTKYPAAPFVAVALALAILAFARGGWRRKVVACLVFTAAATLLYLPWLVKNVVFTGNPFYPLLYSLFGGAAWSPVQDARWVFAHSPKGGLAWEQWARHVFGTFFSDDLVTALCFLFAPLVVFARGRSRRVAFAGAFALLYVLLWLAMTHRIERFLLPGIAVLGAVSGVGLFALAPSRVRTLLAALAVGLAALNVFYLGGLYGQALGLDPSVPLFGNYDRFLKDKLPGYEAWTYLDGSIGPDSRVLLVGESQTFYLDFPFSASTVFDYQPLDAMAKEAGGDPAATARLVAAARFDYVFVNWAEVRRLQDTYAFTAADGSTVPVYGAAVSPDFFRRMADSDTITPVYSSGPEVWPGVPAYVLYRVE